MAVLLNQGVIKQKLIDLLMSWIHNPGFNTHSKGQISGSDGEAIEKVARYMSRATISVERVEFNPNDIIVTVYEKQGRSPSCKQAIYTLLEFIALLVGHIAEGKFLGLKVGKVTFDELSEDLIQIMK